jgi:Ca2+-binding EF-hand superfamily protein
MGGAQSGSSEKMAVVALSQVIQCRRADLLTLRVELSHAAAKQAQQGAGSHHHGSTMVSRKDLDDVMHSLHLEESDVEIYSRLFTLFDRTGGGKVVYLNFCIGLTPIINGTLIDRIMLAFEMADEEAKGYVSKDTMREMFKNISLTCGFLGDNELPLEQIDELCDSLYAAGVNDVRSSGAGYEYGESIDICAEHPIIESWLLSHS